MQTKEELFHQHFDRLLTEPLTVTALAGFFDVSRGKMSEALVSMRKDGAEKFGGLWRVPLRKMPPKYWES